MNLDDATESSNYWVAYAKRNNCVVYLDSFGNLPLKELVRYFGKDVAIEYNFTSYETYDQSFCSYVCGFSEWST